MRKFQVEYGEDSPPDLPLQQGLNEGQRIAVMLHLSIQAAVVDRQPPFSSHLLGDDQAGGCPLGVTGLVPTSANQLSENLLSGPFPLDPEGQLTVPIHIWVWLQSYSGLTLPSMNRLQEHRLSTDQGITILLLQPGPQCLGLGALIGHRLGFAWHLHH